MVERRLLISVLGLLAVVAIVGGWWLFNITTSQPTDVTFDLVQLEDLKRIESTKKMARDNIRYFLTNNIF